MDRRAFLRAALSAPLACPLAGRAARAQAGSVPVVATFTILADLARQVGGGRVAVTSLIGPDADAHGFEPAPADAARLAAARVVVANGLGFEGWIDRLVAASGTKATLVVASRGITPRRDGHGHDHSHGKEHGHGVDPHAFQSVAHVMTYVRNIRDGLVAADPAGRPDYERATDAYLIALGRLETDIRAGIATIPPARRKLITNHDAFAYFGAAYGLAFVGLQGVSTSGDISARDVAQIVRQIKAEKIPAVFLENVSNPRIMEQIAKESGARIGGRLYSDALSPPDGPAPTYERMMRANLGAIVEALAPA